MNPQYHGKPLTDATEPLKVRVMRRDIERATPRDPSCCAIAQGALRQKPIVGVRIGAKYVYIEYKDQALRYELMPEDKKKVRRFDISEYFEPDVYILRPPVRKLGNKYQQRTGSKVKEGKRKNVKNVKVEAAEPLRHL